MKTLYDLLPLAIGVALLGAATWFLLDRGWGIGAWVLAALLFAHGWVHLMFVFPQPDPTAGGPTWPFDLGRSWMITGLGLDAGLIRGLGVALMGATLVGFLLAALATIGVLVPGAWWPGLLIGSAAASLLLLGLSFSPSLVLGIGIDLVLLWFVVASVWAPRIAAGGGSG